MVRLEELVGRALAEGVVGGRGSSKLRQNLGSQGKNFLLCEPGSDVVEVRSFCVGNNRESAKANNISKLTLA